MDDEQLRQRLEEARRLILAADARLRFYAFVPNASEDMLEAARRDWYGAEDILWEVFKGRAKNIIGAIDAFTAVTGALILLIDTLTVGLEPLEQPPPGTV